MLYGSKILGSTKTLAVVARSFRTSTIVRKGKTPIQEFGWQYLLRQKASGRPISPHMFIYKPQLTWVSSITHRIFGVMIAGGFFAATVPFLFNRSARFEDFIDWARRLELPRPLIGALKLSIAFVINFYVLTEIRFLFFNLAIGTDIKNVYRSGWAVLALSVVLSLAMVLLSKQRSTEEVLKDA